MGFNPFQFLTRQFGSRSTAGGALGRTMALVQKTANLPAYRASLPELAAELARARRYHRPLAVVVLELEREGLVEPFSHLVSGNGNGIDRKVLTHTTQIVSFVLASVLRDTLRESDIATFLPATGRHVLLLAESGMEEARNTVHRLNDLFYRRMAARFRAGIAQFPADGLTLDKLVAQAQQQWQQETAPLAQVEMAASANQDS